MTEPIQLSRLCYHCAGKGYFVSGVTIGGDFIPEKVSCPDCNGRGKVLTWEGWATRAARRVAK